MGLPAALRTLLALLGLLVSEALAAAAEASPAPQALTCSATRLSSGSTSYRLSQPPSSDQCETSWEDSNKTAIAHNSEFDSELVQSLTSASITLRGCRDLLYSQNCWGDYEEAPCHASCGDVLQPDRPPTLVVNTTCSFESWCPNRPRFIVLSVVLVLVLVAIAVGYLLHQICSKLRRRQRIPYTPAAQQVKTQMEMEEV